MILTKDPITKGSPATFTLDKAALALVTSVSNDAYYSSQDNWKTVVVAYKSDTGNQFKKVTFDVSGAGPYTAPFLASIQSKDVFDVFQILILDYDGGYFPVYRLELTTGEFDIDMGISGLISTLLYSSDIDTTYDGPISTTSIGNKLFVSFWAKIDSQGGTDYNHQLVKIPSPNNTNDYIRLYTDSSSQIKAVFKVSDGSELAVAGNVANLFDNWRHFVVGIDTTSARSGDVYIDGVSIISASGSGPLTTILPDQTSKFFYNFKGSFANLEIWTSKLSAANVTTLYNAGYTETPQAVLPASTLYRSFLAKPAFFTGPYSETLIANGGFETGDFTNFTAVNGTQTNKWFVGTADKFAGTYAVYVSNNSSDSAYTPTLSSTVHFYTDIIVPTGVFNIGFRANIGGENNYDALQVQVSTNTGSVPVAGSVWAPGSIIGSLANLNNTAGAFNFYSTGHMVATAGSTVRVCFTWKNDNSVGVQPGAVVDNISLIEDSTLEDTTNTYKLNILGTTTLVDTSIPYMGVVETPVEQPFEYFSSPSSLVATGESVENTLGVAAFAIDTDPIPMNGALPFDVTFTVTGMNPNDCFALGLTNSTTSVAPANLVHAIVFRTNSGDPEFVGSASGYSLFRRNGASYGPLLSLAPYNTWSSYINSTLTTTFRFYNDEAGMSLFINGSQIGYGGYPPYTGNSYPFVHFPTIGNKVVSVVNNLAPTST
jgi:hypothetical protein